MKKKPIYLYQCIVCGENFYTDNPMLKHCNKLMQWVKGIPGKGLDMTSPKVKIKVSGYIEMTQENLDTLLSHSDPHMGIVYAIHMAYTDASNLEFEPEE